VESIETSSLHLDLISDLRRINSHICSIAYPILEEAGVLARTLLKTDATEAPDRAAPVADSAAWQKRKPRTA
jgi:phosphate:Na+ symporter